MVLDPHTHAWGPPSPEYPWVNGPLVEHDVASFDVDPVYDDQELLRDMDRTAVDEAVVVGYPINYYADNAYTIEVAEAHDRLHAVVMLDPFADDAADALRADVRPDGVVGFRLAPICPLDRMWETFDPSADWLLDAIEEDAFWEATQEEETVVQLLVHADQLDQVRELVERYPDLTYLIDHFAQVPGDTPPAEGFAELEPLAEFDSVAVKASEVVHRSNEDFPYRDCHEHLRWLLDAFGRERVIWGSDFPNVSDEATYGESLRWLDRVDFLSTGDREWLVERAFRRHVGL